MAFWLENGRVRKKALTQIEWSKVLRPRILAYDDQIGRLAAGVQDWPRAVSNITLAAAGPFDLGIPGTPGSSFFGALGVGRGAAWGGKRGQMRCFHACRQGQLDWTGQDSTELAGLAWYDACWPDRVSRGAEEESAVRVLPQAPDSYAGEERVAKPEGDVQLSVSASAVRCGAVLVVRTWRLRLQLRLRLRLRSWCSVGLGFGIWRWLAWRAVLAFGAPQIPGRG
ncbi:hypothetical protein N431DRAFT_124501 [Stipitochalara longipes BDJ]|nr:hypothetical protein N431DRAFT_124501 [Stipitochalara longipes BDJ]